MLAAKTITGLANASLPDSSTQLNDLIEPFADLRKQGIGHGSERMCLGLAQAPVERLGLVAKHVAGLRWFTTWCFSHRHGKRIVRIIFRCRHGQADDQRGLLVEDARREHQKGMNIAHFAPNLRIAIDPDDVLPVRSPWLAFARCRSACHYLFDSYQRSAPSVCVVVICSPPWRLGS